MRAFSKCQPASVTSGGAGLTPAALNTTWPVDPILIDASAMVPQVANGPTETRIAYPTALQRRNALGFSNAGTETAYFFLPWLPTRWDFSMANARLRLYGSPAANSATGTNVVFEVATRNLRVSDDADDTATFPWSSNVATTLTGRGAYNEMGGIDSTVTPPSPGGRALSALTNTNDNFLQFRIQRTPGAAGDTFANTFYLYAAAFQWTHDFNNVLQMA